MQISFGRFGLSSAVLAAFHRLTSSEATPPNRSSLRLSAASLPKSHLLGESRTSLRIVLALSAVPALVRFPSGWRPLKRRRADARTSPSRGRYCCHAPCQEEAAHARPRLAGTRPMHLFGLLDPAAYVRIGRNSLSEAARTHGLRLPGP